MKRIFYKSTVVIPLFLILYSLTKSFALCIPEVGLFIETWTLSRLIVILTILWLCCSPFKKSCCNGTITEPLFNLFPVELVLFIVFSQRHFIISIIIALFLLACEIALFLYFRKDEKKHEFTKERHHRYKAAFRRCSLLGTAVFCAVPCFLTLFVYGMQSPYYNAEEEAWDRLFAEAETVSDNDYSSNPYQNSAELWECFSEEKWSKWSISEKTTIMQRLVDFETEVLGIPAITLNAGMIGTSTLGSYDNKLKEIWINTEHLANSSVDKCIHTICHEVYHSNQYFLVETLDRDNPALNSAYFSELREWMDNQEDYKDAFRDGIEAYENQPLEASANAFAEKETAKIKKFINTAEEKK